MKNLRFSSSPISNGTTFLNAISSFFRHYSDFSGKSTRKEFIYWYLFELLLVSVMYASYRNSKLIPYISLLWTIATFMPTLALGSRRINDSNLHCTKLVCFFPYIGDVVGLLFSAYYLFFNQVAVIVRPGIFPNLVLITIKTHSIAPSVVGTITVVVICVYAFLMLKNGSYTVHTCRVDHRVTGAEKS